MGKIKSSLFMDTVRLGLYTRPADLMSAAAAAAAAPPLLAAPGAGQPGDGGSKSPSAYPGSPSGLLPLLPAYFLKHSLKSPPH